MGTKFNQCPNCQKTITGGLLGGAYFKVYECKKCKTCYCDHCGSGRCPNCAAKERQEVGEVRKYS